MESGRWRIKLLLLGAGAVLILAAWLGWPHATLWYARRDALARIAEMPRGDRARMNLVLATGVKKVPPAPATGKRIAHGADGWRFSLPAAEYRRHEDPNRPLALVGETLSVNIGGVWTQTPKFRPDMAPTNAQVQAYVRDTEPYDILADAFTTTAATVRAARSHAELQKALYLLLMRSILQPTGSDKQWLRIELAGRRGFLAGDETSRAILVSVYLPETTQFAEIAIAPQEGATMADVWRCLGQLHIDRDAATTGPLTLPAAATRPAPTTRP